MNGTHPEGQDGPTLPLQDLDAERHVAQLTGMTPEAIAQRLDQTATDLGAPGFDPQYGWGLVDASAATSGI